MGQGGGLPEQVCASEAMQHVIVRGEEGVERGSETEDRGVGLGGW